VHEHKLKLLLSNARASTYIFRLQTKKKEKQRKKESGRQQRASRICLGSKILGRINETVVVREGMFKDEFKLRLLDEIHLQPSRNIATHLNPNNLLLCRRDLNGEIYV
jgi:hypothetical protein